MCLCDNALIVLWKWMSGGSGWPYGEWHHMTYSCSGGVSVHTANQRVRRETQPFTVRLDQLLYVHNMLMFIIISIKVKKRENKKYIKKCKILNELINS